MHCEHSSLTGAQVAVGCSRSLRVSLDLTIIFDGVWYAALKAAGIEDFRFHDLRHTTASYLAAQGASLLEIADTLGHKTLSMVKRYSHLARSHKVTAIEKMAKERNL